MGGCRNVAITDTGGDLALNGKNDYAYTAGIPQALADALESITTMTTTSTTCS